MLPERWKLDELLAEQQQLLFDIGAVLAMAGEYDPPTLATGLTALDEQTEAMNRELPALTEFVIPWRKPANLPRSSVSHNLPSSGDRCLGCNIGLEKRLESIHVDRLRGAGACLNRLSDFFFVLARTLSQHQDQTESQWRGPSNS